MSERHVICELFKLARKIFPNRRTILKGFNDLQQNDLAEFNPYAKVDKRLKYNL